MVRLNFSLSHLHAREKERLEEDKKQYNVTKSMKRQQKLIFARQTLIGRGTLLIQRFNAENSLVVE